MPDKEPEPMPFWVQAMLVISIGLSVGYVARWWFNYLSQPARIP